MAQCVVLQMCVVAQCVTLLCPPGVCDQRHPGASAVVGGGRTQWQHHAPGAHCQGHCHQLHLLCKSALVSHPSFDHV